MTENSDKESNESELEEIIEVEEEKSEEETKENIVSFSNEEVEIKNLSPENLSLALEKINFSSSQLENNLNFAPRISGGEISEKNYEGKYDGQYNENRYDEKIPDYSEGNSEKRNFKSGFSEFSETIN